MSNERREFTQMNEAFAEEGIDLDEYVALERELDELEREAGIRQEKGLSRLISSFFERQDARERVLVNKKKLLWVAFLLGWCGGHRFMLKQKWVGLLYLAFCWTSFPIAMTIVDFIQYIPMKPDENGNILV